MPLPSGTRIGVYEVLELAGQGGMGTVFRARDTQLGRIVALKILPEVFASDPDRVQRFEREARALAALNHSNIAQVYGLERVPGETGGPALQAIAMEFVEGRDLGAVTPLPVERALELARQIANALDVAHRAGIVHRDVKPANVRVTPGGVAKVLDFGIARIDADVGAGDATASLVTGPGATIGTPGYMSPEQLRGESVDRQTDIWAFGCILFELLAGQRVFGGATRSDATAATLEREPNWSLLPPSTPEAVVALLRRCLQRDRSRRLRDIGDAALVLEDALSTPVKPATRVRLVGSARRAAVIALASAASAALATWLLTRPPHVEAPAPVRFEIETLAAEPLNVTTTTPTVALSADGKSVAYVSARAAASGGVLVVRRFDDLTARIVDGVPRAREPFFSPDGQWLGYQGDGGLTKVPTAGGEPRVIAVVKEGVRGAAWQDDGTIVFATTDVGTGLLRVSADGGVPAVLTTPNQAAAEDHVFPSSLPRARGVLYTVTNTSTGITAAAVFDSRSHTQKVLVPGAACARYDAGGFLVYAADGSLSAVPFDLERLTVTGESVRLVDRVLTARAACAYFATSSTGVLAYVPAEEGDGVPGTLVWVDRRGVESLVSGAPSRAYRDVRLSPDGSKLAMAIDAEDRDIWTWDFAREALSRVTTGRTAERNPVWTPNGQRLVYSSYRERFHLYSQSADGSGPAERLTTGARSPVPISITADGQYLLGNWPLPGQWQLFRLRLDGTREAESLFDVQGNFPSPSPSGRFIAYASYESAPPQVYLRPFPRAADARWLVSPSGGSHPKWSRNGRELFFRDLAGRVMAVPVDASGDAPRLGAPAVVVPRAYELTGDLSTSPFDVSLDGQRILTVKKSDTPQRGGRIVVWLNALARR